MGGLTKSRILVNLTRIDHKLEIEMHEMPSRRQINIFSSRHESMSLLCFLERPVDYKSWWKEQKLCGLHFCQLENDFGKRGLSFYAYKQIKKIKKSIVFYSNLNGLGTYKMNMQFIYVH